MSERSSRDGKARVALFGLGTVGRSALALCLQRPWIEIVGAVARGGIAPGTPLNEIVTGAPAAVVVSDDPDEMLTHARPEVALMATRSPIADVFADLQRCARAGVDVVGTSEELACPAAAHDEYSAALAELAASGGVAILATGINPGFVFDALPVMLAGAAWTVDTLEVFRSLDASVFGRTVHGSLGIDYDAADFPRQVAAGRIRGHIGFAESCRVIGDAMGVRIDHFEEALEPVVADREYRLREYTLRPGRTAGVVHTASARAGGRDWIRFDLRLHVDPASVGWETVDRIVIAGEHPIDVTISPGLGAVSTTAARLVNSIPDALRAPPGLYRAAELLPNPPWFGTGISR